MQMRNAILRLLEIKDIDISTKMSCLVPVGFFTSTRIAPE